MQEQASREEWEAIVGGSWLNKVGVFVLVIGLALFLGYSFRYLGPAGRVAIGFVLSAAILLGGVILERRARYVIFGRGLIGGGWAALYFTTYAMHGLEASRVVVDPMLAMILLGAAAAGMIIHSLRYRSEIVTGLAYLSGFVAIAISPVSSFSVIASVPLAGSLLFVAQRFSWTNMVVAGVIGTYGTYAVKYGTIAQTSTLLSDFASGQLVLAIYWLMFEGCDLMDMLRRREAPGLARAIFPLNVCGFVGISLLYWPSFAQETLYLFFMATGAAYLASTMIRAKVRPPSSFPEGSDTVQRMIGGGYEVAITLTVVLVTTGMLLKFSGLDLNLVLLLEGEFLLLAGLRLKQPYLRLLAAAVFVLPVIKMVAVDIQRVEQITAASASLRAWTPVALLTASVFYLNRWLASRELLSQRFLELAYGFAATALLLVILNFEMPLGNLGIGYLLLALALFEIGLRRNFEEFRIHSYLASALGLAVLLSVNVLGQSSGTRAADYLWTTLMPAAFLAYGATARVHRLVTERLPESERAVVRVISSWAGTVMVAGLAWHALPRPYVGLAWLVMAVPLFEAGLRARLGEIRMQSYAIGVAGLGAIDIINIVPLDFGAAPHASVVIVPAALLVYAAAARMYRLAPERMEDRERGIARFISSWAGTALVAWLVWYSLPRTYLGLGWLIMTVPLFEVGLRARLGEVRAQSYVMAVAGLATIVIVNIIGLDFGGAPHPWMVLVPAALLTYGAAIRMHRLTPEWLEEHERGAVRLLSSWAGTALVAWLVWYSLPRTYLGLGWLIMGVSLFEVGLRARLGEVRLQSYVMGVAGLAALAVVNVYGLDVGDAPYPWMMLAPAALLAYAGAARMLRLLPGRLPDAEQLSLRDVSSLAGTVLLALVLWSALPTPVVAVGWGIIGLLLFELGFSLAYPLLRRQASVVLALAFGRLFLTNFTGMGETFAISHRVLTVLPLIVLFYYLWARLKDEARQQRALPWEQWVAILYLYAPVVLAVALIRFEAGRVLAVVGWALLGVGLLIAGIRLNNRDLRWQSYAVAILTFARCWATNFYIPESLAGMFGRVFAGTVVTASFFAAQFLSPRHGDETLTIEGNWLRRLLIRFDARGRTVFSLLAIILLTVLIFYEVSGNLLTVAWALEGAVLLGVGFAAHERVMRLSGLLLLAACILKVFAYDFQQLEALFRILSFIVLGLLLIGVSLLYTRFREQLRQYL
ncbi:MAG: hypothetical protein A3G24_25130 [Betaproteobacteria bacterium RIFCSPLOWO2_12_FULL_62_13]|nr:MAG: hypothetical protein A3G24_25130 [Betaproteobacteria bacterium RIFCSPLOWO2_12_FULL_62_13]